MHNILVINAGSSSLKYQLIDMDEKKVLAKGYTERIGMDKSIVQYKRGDLKLETYPTIKDHVMAVEVMIDALLNPETGVIKSLDEIKAVGHRVAHGGDYKQSVVITDKVRDDILGCKPLAPLHALANTMGIDAARKAMPNTPMVAVFDTAFHQTMPEKAYTYGIDYEDAQALKIRRYGFHGTSHKYVANRLAANLGKPIEECKLVICHLGGGASISAVKYGKCVDTSMGMTPLEGLIMGTRCGDMDPAIVTYLMDKKGFTAQEVDNYMNKKCGVMGISGVSSDFRDLTAAEKEGNARAKLAQDAFCYRVQKYIGAYAVAMNGLDAVAFTAGIGENHVPTRRRIMTDMDFLGIDFDFERNENFPFGEEYELTKPGSKVKVYIIPTDEEMSIATDTLELTK